MKRIYTPLLLFILLFGTDVTAQQIFCNMQKLAIDDMAKSSTAIVRARVTTRISNWNEQKSFIYTQHEMIVLEVLKGESDATITLITEGGRAEGMSIEFSDRIELEEGEELILFLDPVPAYWDYGSRLKSSYSVYASLQGVFRIDNQNGTINDVFRRFKTIEELANAIHERSGLKSTIAPHVLPVDPTKDDPSGIAVINSLVPSTITAGTRSILTINGSGFGATQGSGFVEFSASDGGFGKPRTKDYISWTDTEIQVAVPSIMLDNIQPACSGIVRVTPSGGVASNTGNLIVRYALFNATDPVPDSSLNMSMVNDNGSGGYTFFYNDQFQTLGSQAKSAMERAVNGWKCATNVNWSIDASTTTIRAAVNDGFNVITDDVQTPLPAGVLGRGINRVALCINGNLRKAITLEMDVIVNNIPGNFTWFFGTGTPTSSQMDFETVLLHECGHLHQINHNSPGGSEVMAPTLSAGVVKRVLTQNDLDGANDIMTRSIEALGCAATAHQPIAGTISISTTATFPVCSTSPITFTAVSTGLSSNTLLEWLVNDVVTATGNSFILNNPINNSQVKCRLFNCSSILSNTIVTQIVTNSASISYGTPFCGSNTSAQLATVSGNTSGTFSASPAGLNIQSGSGAILPSSSTPGTYTVTYTLPPNGPCPSFNTTSIVVITTPPNASFSYSATSFCKSLSAAQSPIISGTPGGTYSASPSGLTINTTTGAITPSTSTAATYTVTRTIAASGGCSATSSTSNITINSQLATPGAIGGLTLNACGVTRTFTINPVSGAISYTWNVPSGVIINGSSTSTSISLTFPSNFGTGTLSVRANAANGCNSNLRSVTVKGSPATPGTITLSNININNFSATASITPVSGATSYTWTGTGVTINSGQGTTQVHVTATANPATLCVRSNNGCGSSTNSCRTVSFFSGGSGNNMTMEEDELNEEEKGIPAIFPNPSSGQFNITFDATWDEQAVKILLMDMSGKLIREDQVSLSESNIISYDCEGLPVGLYMLQFRGAEESKQQLILIE